MGKEVVIISVLVGGVCIILGLSGLLTIPSHIRRQINEKVIMTDKDTLKRWQNPSATFTFNVYVWNINNIDDLISGKESKMNLTQKGPYVFRKTGQNVVKEMDENEITFTPKGDYHFDAAASHPLTLEDTVTTINLPLISAEWTMREKPEMGHMISKFIKESGETLKLTIKVGNLTFWGHRSNFLDKLSPFGVNPRWGLFYPPKKEQYIIQTGKKSMKNLGNIISWREKEELDFWGNGSCQKLEGTDGTRFPPGLTTNSVIKSFSTDLCRVVPFVYDRTVKLNGQVEAYRFMTTDNFFDAPPKNPDNECFCVQKNRSRCTSGALDLNTCLGAAEGATSYLPIRVTSPHFMHAEALLKTVSTGMKPNKEDHSTKIDVEPITGITLRAAKRVQICVDELPLPHSLSENMTELTIPMVWVEELGGANDKSLDKMKGALYKIHFAQKLHDIVSPLMMTLGIIMMIIGFIFHRRMNVMKAQIN